MDTTISDQWRMLSQPMTVQAPAHGLDRLWMLAAGQLERLRRSPQQYLQQAGDILALEKAYRHLSDRRLRDHTLVLKDRFRLGRDTPEDCRHGLAVLREVAARTVNMRPYREQIAAALALNDSCIAEMATGEGKTLVAALPAVLAGWRGRGCHVITANDYLAGRDAQLMKPIYRFCGLTVGCIEPGMAPAERKQAYRAHITYGTNKEVAADFLRDRLISSGIQGLPSFLLAKMSADRGDPIGHLVQRGLACAIVDEADSVFIDDASTPLLISGDGPNQEQMAAYEQAAQLAAGLDPSDDYVVSAGQTGVQLTAAGKHRLAERTADLGGVWSGTRRREELVRQALVAKHIYRRDKHYVLEDDKVVIVDEFTGRLMPDRTWRHGLHQAIEAKEALPINLPKETYARISFQRFFRLYDRLSGMSGTVAESRAEMWHIYGLPVIPIPTHRPCRRTVLPDRVFTTAGAKWAVVVDAIMRVKRTGRPVLVGTGSIHESQQLSDRLASKGVDHHLLNALQHADEARIIAEAGQKQRITVSTNMAGRGTDIKLGDGVAQLGGLHVIATARFSARRIDRQLAGRCARQGDPGSTQAFVSLQDELIENSRWALAPIIRRWFSGQDREISSPVWRRLITGIQRRAERVSFRLRRDVLAADNWLDEQLGFAAKDI